MLKYRNAELVLGALFATVLWTGILGWQASYAPTEREKQECYESAKKTSHKTEDCKTFWERTTSDPVAVFTLVLACSTIGLGVATLFLYLAGRRQLRLARDEFLSTHRPKIRIKHLLLVSAIWHDEPIVVRLVCVNNGTTEATITDYGMKFLVVKEGKALPSDPEFAPIGISGLRLQSGVSLKFPDFFDGTTLTDADHADIRNGKAKLYFLGFLHYLDGVQRLRTTAFCRVLTIPVRLGSYQDIGRFAVVSDPDYEYED